MRSIAACVLFLFLLAPLARAQSTLDKQITKAVAALVCEEPTEREPVTLNATLVSAGDSLAVVVKVNMATGWHIYQHVPGNAPYVPLEHVLKLPKGLTAAGKWQVSKPLPYVSDPGVLIHEEEAWFVQKLTGKAAAGSTITTGLYYQTCDHRQCLPPVEKTIALTVKK